MAKGGKGRKGGGGGGGKTRKYSRDNKGRFASTGSGGATARGGRLKTASGNKRKTQTITAAGQKGVLAKPKGLKPGAIKPKAAAKPATATPKAKSPKFTTEQSGRVRRAALGGGRTAIVRKNSAVIINAKGEPIMTRKGLPNITAGKKYAANPNARGPRLMGRDRSEASPSRGYIRTSRPTGTIGKPKGLKPESTNKLKTGIFISKRRAVNAQLANKPDQAVVNIPGRFTGRAGKSFDASITRAVATVKASKDAKFKTKAEVKADQAKAKAAKEAKPKRIRSAESLRVSRAKQIEKRRSITTNPAGVRASAAAKMAANATRTQQRAAAFYKAGGKPAAAAGAKPARFSASELAERKGYAKQLMAQPKGVRKANYLQRKAQKNPDQLDRFKGRMKFGTQNTINNITEGRSYLTAKKSQFANTPEKRASIERSVTNSGRSLQARMKTTNLGTRLRRLNKPVTTKAAKTKGTIGKPKGLKPGSIKPKAAAAKPARATAKPAVRRKSVGTISEAKAGRIISRIDANRPGLRRASGSARKTANAIRTQQRATDFALAASARGRKQGKNLSVNESLQRGVKNAAAKPARAARTPKTGQEVMKSEVRKVQNKKLRDLNAKIKSAGPNATSLRVEKLALKTKMINTQPRQTANQLAKSAKQDVAIRGRIAEMRKQNARVARAQSNVAKNADVRNSASPMSKASFARRPSKKTMRSQLRADNALAFYANPAKALREVKKKPGFRKPRGMR